MRIGIVGRHPEILHGALALADEAGHDARGTTVDDEALAWVRQQQVVALLIGGGVELESRETLLSACEANDVRGVEVHEPSNLGGILRGLAETGA
jgi:aryl-alcohol dehydrogenase-like predicted oxidoreductase